MLFLLCRKESTEPLLSGMQYRYDVYYEYDVFYHYKVINGDTIFISTTSYGVDTIMKERE